MIKTRTILSILAVLVLSALFFVGAACAATTSVHIVRYANNGNTILNETNVTYQWMEEHLPTVGTSAPYYRFQGPTFNATNLWDPDETLNLDKVNNSIKGTTIRDLCDLVGGMNPGETLDIQTSDNFDIITLNYTNVYSPPTKQGEAILAWWGDGNYVPNYVDGMRIFFLTDDQTFGNWDMHQYLNESDWHYYYGGTPPQLWPSASGVSLKYIDRIFIYSNEQVPFSAAFIADNLTGYAPLTVHFTDQSIGTGLTYAWDFNNDGIVDSTDQNPSYIFNAVGYYSVKLTVTNNEGSDSETKTDYISVQPNVLFDGTVTLTPDATFSQLAYNSGSTYTINETTPLGALHATGLTYDLTDKRWASDQVLLLDNVSTYTKASGKWYAYVNGVYKDGYQNHPDGLNVIQLSDGDTVNFFFSTGTNLTAPTDALAAVKIVVDIPTTPSMDVLFDGDITLNPGTFSFTAYNSGTEYQIDTVTPQGALDAASKLAGFVYNGTDKKWATMGTILLDDVGVYHYDSSFTPKHVWAYAVNGVRKDDFSSTEGISVYRLHNNDLVEFYYGSDGDIIANATALVIVRVHIVEQDVLFDGDVTLLPGTFNFTAYNSGTVYQINTVTLHGALDTASKLGGFVYNATDKKWSALGTMLLDDIGTYHYDSSTSPKHDWAYAVNGVKMNDYSTAEGISTYALQNNDRVVFYYGADGDILANATAVVRIRVHVASTGNWTLTLKGAQAIEVDKQLFEEGVGCIHSATYTDVSGTWEGMPLWDLAGYVDDAVTHGPGAFNDTLAAQGYQIKVIASDGYNKTFSSIDVARNSNYIIANILDGQPLPVTAWPLRLVGANVTASNSVAQIVTIELIGIPSIEPPTEPPSVHIIKYGPDGTTIVNETTVAYTWMEEHLAVIGDGITATKFQGITNDPDDLWSPTNETKGGFKISNVVKGTKIYDLVELVGGMGSGTDVILVAKDNYTTNLPYSSIYTNPVVQEHQGDAILAWWADGNYVPDYADGMRVFFNPADHIYGQWDMHESLPEAYWHYYYQSYPIGDPNYPGVMFPSAAGLSGKWITTIKVYSAPESDWTLELDGRDIGGLNYSVSKTYFEQALACQFGSNHKAVYTDSQGRVWEGMPLWFLAGFVDDADQHSNQAFNDSLAAGGYEVIITGMDGSSTILNSKDIAKNSNYIVANSLNGTHIADIDPSWPLRLVGANITGSQSIKGITKIELKSAAQYGDQTLYFTPESAAVTPGMEMKYTLKMSTLPQGLAGFNISLSLDDPNIGEITRVVPAEWAVLNKTSGIPGDLIWIEVVDLNNVITPGAQNVTLAEITIYGNQTGSTSLIMGVKKMTADGGANITPGLTEGKLVVYVPLIANFSADTTSGSAPLSVSFTDLTSGTPGPTTYLWNFGDGNTSNVQNPLHVYQSYGTYNVSLTVTNPYSQDTEEKIGYIVVARYVEPFPGLINAPTDPDHDGLYEDINGNGYIDYDDIVEFFWNMDWVIENTQVGGAPYDFNGNGYIEYDDVVRLFEEVE